MRIKSFIPLALSLVFLSGCMPKTPSVPVVSDVAAEAKWSNVIQNPFTPMQIDGSLRFGEKNDTTRVTFFLWRKELFPIRLDIFATANTTAAKILENQQGIRIFIPQDNIVYTHEDSTQAFKMFGINLPIGVETIADILQGNFPLAQIPYSEATKLEDGNYRYLVSQKARTVFYGEWTIDAQGRPIHWNFNEWRISFGYNEEFPLMPYKITGSSLNNEEFTLLVRERIQPKTELLNMDFALPDNAQIVPLTIDE